MIKLLCAFALLSAVLASDVLEYKDSDFESKIQNHDVALVEFYAPWCGTSILTNSNFLTINY